MKFREYMDQIEKRVDRLKSWKPSFPFMACTDSAIDLQDGFGWAYVCGVYVGKIDDQYREKFEQHLEERKKDTSRRMEYWRSLGDDFDSVTHSFAYDPNNHNFVDVTAHQFDSSLDEITVINRYDKRVALSEEEISEETTHVVRDFIIGNRNSQGNLEGIDLDRDMLLNSGRIIPARQFY